MPNEHINTAQQQNELVMTKRFRVLDPAEVMAAATHYGRAFGREADWEPSSLQEAIEELELVGEGGPVANGYEVVETRWDL
jgi:hypothetical protein